MVNKLPVDRLINQRDLRSGASLVGLLVAAELMEFEQNKERTPQDGLEPGGRIVIVEPKTLAHELYRHRNGNNFNPLPGAVTAKMFKDPCGIIDPGLAVSICFHLFDESGCHSG